MESKKLNIPDGRVSFDVNGVAEIIFNPTDVSFIERLFLAFEAMDKRQAEYEGKIKNAQPRDIFDIARQADRDIRELVDTALGAEICDKCFPGVNIYAYAEGLPLWANLMLAVLDECDAGTVAQRKLTNPRLEKYTSKYHK